MFERDGALRAYATDKQWKAMEAIWEHGGVRAAARHLECAPSLVSRAYKAVKKKAAKAGYAPENDMIHEVPDGYLVKGASTLYREGKPILQWVKSAIDPERQEQILREIAQGLAESLPQSPASPAPNSSNADLMVCYPVGDHHIGMYAWAEEAGGDYDLSHAESLLTGAMTHLVDRAPDADKAAMIFLGDYIHYDGMVPQTPTSKHDLDSDGRYAAVVRSAFRAAKVAIDAALKKHRHVHVIFEPGNHDPSATIFLQVAFDHMYEREPRITVDTSPRLFHYLRHGKCLIGVHHGHTVRKPADLPLLMATDRPDDWGQTNHRYWYTGHVHHDQRKDYNGCTVESFRILPPADAYAYNAGYRSVSDMKAIVLHAEHGEVARYTVNPRMMT